MCDSNRRAVVMYSGGRDSLLLMARMVNEGWDVYPVTLQPGYVANIEFSKFGIRCITASDKFKERVHPIGGRDICGIYKELNASLHNITFNGLAERYPNMTCLQMNCLVCRTAMLVAAALIAQAYGINTIALGDLSCDRFVCQQQSVMEYFKSMISETFGVTIKRPLMDIEDKSSVKNELSLNGLPVKVIEPSCVIAGEMVGAVTEEICGEAVRFVKNRLLPVISKNISIWKSIISATPVNTDSEKSDK